MPFNPAFNFYDEKDTMVLSVQRITLNGTNTNFPAQDVSIESAVRKGGGSLMILKDKEKKILAVAVGGKYPNTIVSYDSQESTDLIFKGGKTFTEGLIRLSPSCQIKGDYNAIFEQLRKERDKKDSDASVIVLAK